MMPHKNVTFLEVLKEISGCTTVRDFARACGKQEGNMANRLNGHFIPQEKFLKTCMENLYSWPIRPMLEIEPLPRNRKNWPTGRGIYVIYDCAGHVLYVGKAKNFRSEVEQTLRRALPAGIRVGKGFKNVHPKIRDIAKYVSLYAVDSDKLRTNVEAMFLRVLINQTHNRNIGRFR
jgi:hypothetical protein